MDLCEEVNCFLKKSRLFLIRPENFRFKKIFFLDLKKWNCCVFFLLILTSFFEGVIISIVFVHQTNLVPMTPQEWQTDWGLRISGESRKSAEGVKRKLNLSGKRTDQR